ncbi:Uncharacterised protein [Bordetella pertussis]|nr:Uncharacterised protein [Bordetella pertussis]CFP62932.1 Uncharacterised protein [Bordetella pertussis]CFU02299.1 Uncharacterised protein [Bordetella pertussis]
MMRPPNFFRSSEAPTTAIEPGATMRATLNRGGLVKPGDTEALSITCP